jgi:PAS domain S-box-containing protein
MNQFSIEQSGIRLAFTLFEFVMVCIGLFYTILESNRQKKGEYSLLTWGLASYFVSLIIEILAVADTTAHFVASPFFRILGDILGGAGFVVLSYALVTHRLIERKQFLLVLRVIGLSLLITFGVSLIIAAISPAIASRLFWHPVSSFREVPSLFACDWVFAVQEIFLLLYALATLITQARAGSLYAQGFFIFLAFGRLAMIIRLAVESIPAMDSMAPMVLESLADPLGFLFLVMAINQLITEDLQKLNLQLMRRTELLEDATRSLTKLNQLSTNLLKTTKISDIAETILAGLADEFGLIHTFLLLLDKQSGVLKGIRLDSNGRGYHFMDLDMRHDHFLRSAMLRGKPLFFGEGTRMPDKDFIKNYNLSKNLVTVPLLTKKETTCFEMYGCDKVSCPVQAFGWNTCWLCKEECPYYKEGEADNLADCIQCKAFNIVGMLVIDNRNPNHKVDEENLAFLETFANQAGMAVHNAMLVEDLSREITFRERTFKSLPNGVMVLDEKGLIQSLNPSLLIILGMKDTDVTGIPFEAVRLVNDEERFHKIVSMVLTEGRNYEGIGESWTLTLPGRTLKLNIKVNPLPGSGKRFGAVILFEDITDVTALQEQLFRSEKLATIGQMAAGIAHEVNNPLAGVSGFLQVMASRLPEDSPERSAMQAALTNINRASGTIKDLLRFARLGPANKRPTSINEVIEESLIFVQFQKEHQGIKIVRDFNEKLPYVVADPDQIRQVITNLVLNAVQAMGNEGTLLVTTTARNGIVRIYIEDTGSGIPTENFESIFEPWFTTKQAKGTGLGLTNSDRIISDHNGTLAFSSVEGKGTTFIIDLPASDTIE